jgi:TetR/AcrR family transcriptional repressor of nem operon
LVAEAVQLAFDQILSGLRASLEGKPADAALATLVRQYLSVDLRDHIRVSCPLSAMGTELRRADPRTGEVALIGMQKLISLIAGQMTGVPRRQANAHAHGIAAAMVGAIVLSRLAPDTQLGGAILRDTREFILRSR